MASRRTFSVTCHFSRGIYRYFFASSSEMPQLLGGEHQFFEQYWKKCPAQTDRQIFDGQNILLPMLAPMCHIFTLVLKHMGIFNAL